MNRKNIILLSAFALYVAACGGTTQNETTSEETTQETVAQAEEPPKAHPGKSVYMTYCMTCHQKNGEGVPGLNPPLANTDWVNGDKTRLINIVLNGLSGEIEVNGEKYNNVMAAHSFLTDTEIANVLSYIRQDFGNSADPITPEEVAAVRNP